MSLSHPISFSPYSFSLYSFSPNLRLLARFSAFCYRNLHVRVTKHGCLSCFVLAGLVFGLPFLILLLRMPCLGDKMRMRMPFRVGWLGFWLTFPHFVTVNFLSE